MTFILMTTIRLGLWLLPFRVLLKLQTKMMSLIHQTSNPTPVDLGKIITCVNLATRYMPGGAKCLARALTTQVLMHHYNYSGELRIGVAKSTTGSLEAHAWIEHQGQVIIGNLEDLSRFIPLPSLSGVRL
jgi:Transglutaminase-like superfamily